MENCYNYYIASPGFNKDQLDRIHEVENMLKKMEVSYYSPFEKGNRMDPNQSLDMLKFNAKLIFDENINNIRTCSNMIALVHDVDKGTYYECGYFAALHTREVTNNKLLLLGKHAPEVSSAIARLHDSLRAVQSRCKFYDITKKDPIDYISMGFYAALGYRVYTYSDGKMDSNIMTACGVENHYTRTDNVNNLSFDQFKKLKEEDLDHLFSMDNSQLAPFKFFDKVE